MKLEDGKVETVEEDKVRIGKEMQEDKVGKVLKGRRIYENRF